jgi:hypothetical protein
MEKPETHLNNLAFLNLLYLYRTVINSPVANIFRIICDCSEKRGIENTALES